MNAPSPNGSPHDSPLDVERVEWVPVSAHSVELRVVGRWRGPAPPDPPELVVAGQRLPAIGHGALGGAWRASFSVPIELRPRLEERLTLALGPVEVTLPGASAGPADEGSAPPPAQVVEHGVLAERRARREGLADDSLLRRAQAAEATAATLRTQLGHIEEGLRQAVAERERLQRELRAAEQREESERRVREELTEERDQARREADRRLGELRGRVRSAEEHAAELAAEMDAVRREGAEAQQAAVAARRAAERAEQAALAREAEAARRLAEGEQLEREQLAAERRAREALEHELDAERERLTEAQAGLAGLEAELARRADVQAAVREEIQELRDALTRAREQGEGGLGPGVEGVLADLRDTAARLRGRVGELERSERDARSGLQRAERALDDARRHAAELGARLEGERRRRYELEAGLRAEIEREREGLATQLAAAEAELRVRLAAHRQAFEDQVAEIERGAGELRAHLAEVGAELDQGLGAERAAREAAEAALAERERELAERAGREAAIQELVADVLRAATGVRDGFAQQLQAVEDRAQAEVEAERARLRGELVDVERAVAELRDRLEEERAAREAAERALEAERSASSAPAAEPVVSPEELERARHDLAAAQEELARVRSAADLRDEARSMIANLEQAGQRLRSEREALERREAAVAEAEASAAVGPAPAAPPAPEPPAAEPSPAAPEPPDLTRMATTSASPTRRPGSHIVRPRIVPAERRSPTRWLVDGITGLAVDEPDTAAELLVGLLHAQGLPGERELSYRLTLDGQGTYRVVIRGSGAEVFRSAPDADDEVDLQIAGPVGALAPLAAGGAGRRLAGVRIEGSRWRARRLLRARREPLDLGAAARRGVLLDPGPVLAALGRMIDPAWTAGHRFSIAFVITGRDPGTHWITVDDGRPVAVGQEPPSGETSTIVQVGQPAFLPLLTRVAPPAAERALLLGSADAYELLSDWADRVQGLSEPGD